MDTSGNRVLEDFSARTLFRKGTIRTQINTLNYPHSDAMYCYFLQCLLMKHLTYGLVGGLNTVEDFTQHTLYTLFHQMLVLYGSDC